MLEKLQSSLDFPTALSLDVEVPIREEEKRRKRSKKSKR